MSAWRPIETAPIAPFDRVRWWALATPLLLVCCKGGSIDIANYSYTKTGKGRWRGSRAVLFDEPTHWQPLPEPPEPLS